MARILAIDDDPVMREILRNCLERDGHSVLLAADGKAGLRILETEQVDLVITDILMPESDGYEVAVELLKLPQRPKIMIISGGSYLGDQAYLLSVAQSLRVDKVLAKPASCEQLSAAVREIFQ